VVIDHAFSVIGTANMNHRSFNLDFEVNAHVYDASFSKSLQHVFYADIQYAERLNYSKWKARPVSVKLVERIARLFSPVM
jgi:cardiolipin synthase